MSRFFKKSMVKNIILIIIFATILIISLSNIKLDMSIYKLLPENETLSRTLSILEKSPVADKVILYIDFFEEDKLQEYVSTIQSMIDETYFYKNEKNKDRAIGEKWTLINFMPKATDINDILAFAEDNNLLLYPYEILPNPFTEEAMADRLQKSENYLDGMAFSEPSESFFNDPLFMGFDFLSLLNTGGSFTHLPKFNGILSSDGKAYIKIFNAGFLSQDYDNSKTLSLLDKKISEYAKKNGFNAFLYCAHLYYLESFSNISGEMSLIFFFSIFLTFLIFYLFFRKFTILLYAIMPILGGFAFKFMFIAIFKGSFGGISFAFGATIAGIAIDYVVNYLSKISLYPTLKEFRKKVGFSLFLGCGTTLLVFVILMFSDISSLKEIGLAGFLGILFSFLIAFFVLQKIIPPEEYCCNIRVLNMPKTNKYVFGLWIIFIFVVLFGVFSSRFEDNLKGLDNRHPKLDKRIAQIQSHFNESTDSNFLVFQGKDRGDILENASKAFHVLYKENRELAFLSPSLFYLPENLFNSRKEFVKNNFNVNLFKKVLGNSSFESDAFDSFLNNIKNIDILQVSNYPSYVENVIDKMIVDIDGKEYLLIQVNDTKKADTIKSILSQHDIDFFIMNAFKDSASGLVAFEKRAVVLIFIAIFFIAIVLSIAYRNILSALFAIFPPLSAVLACIATATFTGRGVNIMHITSSIILIGIGVDYGIYVVTAFKNGYSDREKNMTYQSILICALTTLAGFGVLAFSSNQAVFSLGSGMFAGIVTAFLTSYLIVPFLYQKFVKK